MSAIRKQFSLTCAACKMTGEGSRARIPGVGFLVGRGELAYTLTELLCSMGIIVLLAAMLLPSLRNGYARAQRIYCVNNLHQTGLAFHSFAHGHQDRFPMQVSTNDGGSWEFLKAANNMTGEFYFSYQHFLPLANDLAVPKILACPADTRQAATNFAALQNENLSYFAAGNPEFGNPSSLLTGDRNVSPVYGSVATVGTYRCLRWTEELHRFKGNVLFSDGHVDMLNDVFSITNRVAAAAPTTLHLPSVRPTAPAPGGGEGVPYEYAGGGPPAVRPFTPVIPVFTNRLGTNQTVTNWWVSGQRVRNSWLAFPDGNSGDAGGVSPAPASSPSPPLAAAPTAYRRVGEPAAAPGGLRGVYQQVKDRGGAVLRRAAVVVYDIPWYLLLLLIAALLELRRRIRARQKAIIRHPIASSAH